MCGLLMSSSAHLSPESKHSHTWPTCACLCRPFSSKWASAQAVFPAYAVAKSPWVPARYAFFALTWYSYSYSYLLYRGGTRAGSVAETHTTSIQHKPGTVICDVHSLVMDLEPQPITAWAEKWTEVAVLRKYDYNSVKTIKQDHKVLLNS